MSFRTDQFAHLHVHTDASIIDGLGPVSRLVDAANKAGYKHLAMTDHGTLTNTVTFVSECQKVGIKPIVGMEGYLEVDGDITHITLLADGNKGFSNLTLLNNIGQSSEYRRPAFNIDELIQHAENLILLTGCPASIMQKGNDKVAIEVGKRLKSAFGSNMFAEVMFASEHDKWERSQKLYTDLNIPVVLTNDVHFAYKEDATIHKVLTQLKATFEYESQLLYLASPSEILKRIDDRKLGKNAREFAEKGIRNALRLANKISPVSFSSQPTLPHIERANEKLENLVYKKIRQLAGKTCGHESDCSCEFDHDLYCKYIERAEYELDIILSMDFAAYFLIFRNIIQYAKNRGVKVGAGRGSGAGSLVLFLIGITEVDPLEWGLSFDRFLNKKRKGMPDVDVDFDSWGRQEVIDYAIRRWNGHPVATYSRYSHKMLVHDLAKYFRLPRHLERDAADKGIASKEFKELEEMKPEFRKAYDAMYGQIRHIGKHAGGVVITEFDIPTIKTSDGTQVAAWTEGQDRELTQVGVVKYDILGLSALTVLKLLEERTGIQTPDPMEIEDDDPLFSLFENGDTNGIFQFSGSAGIVDYTRRFKPKTLQDLYLVNALYRPGALDAGTAELFIELREKDETRKFHPLFDEILEETRGVIVTQEQVMGLYRAAVKGDEADADLARRTISKIKVGDPDSERKVAILGMSFHDGARGQGVPHQMAMDIWEEIEKHSRYSFNKSHAVSYAMISLQMAWWKYYHRAKFYAAYMTVDRDNTQQFIFEIVQRGIEVVAPHVNVSGKEFVEKDGKIYMPLNVVKFLGDIGVESIIEAAPFSDWEDFMNRVPKRHVTKRARIGLYEMGGFDGLNGDYSKFDIDEPEEKLNMHEKSSKYMGFILPSLDLMEYIDDYNKRPNWTAGIITNVKDKKSPRHGPYKVYYFAPFGSCWSRDYELDKGQFYAVKTHAKTGKILTQVLLD